VPPRDELVPGSPQDWLRRARSSYALACVSKPDDTCWEELCFQAQQAAEKAIKAIMLHYDIRFPYVHDLGALLDAFEKSGHDVSAKVKECVDLTPYAFQTRYPGEYEPVTEPDYRRALSQAQAVLDWAAKIIS